jgi:NAD(P)-dependent dehydrogenase (short-subunit alcohol dehydrogenase family)
MSNRKPMNVDLSGMVTIITGAGGIIGTPRHMIKQGEGGSIINISSVMGVVPAVNQCAFAAAKAGLINFTKAIATELGPYKIRANSLCPGGWTCNIPRGFEF